LGKLPTSFPLVTGHKGPVLDVDFHPFNSNIVASVSEDGNGRIWSIPEGGFTANANEPAQLLLGHKRKVGTVDFHPVADNLVVTSSNDFTVKLWDIQSGNAVLNVDGHADIINNVAWNQNGSLLSTASKDKKVRIIDPRGNSVVNAWEAHTGVKGTRAAWLGHHDLLLTLGFSKTSDRQFAIWDLKNTAAPLTIQNVDTASGMFVPLFDDDTGILYLVGKGDGNIRYYEVCPDQKDIIYYLSEFKTAQPQLGAAFRPKTYLNVSGCEIANILKITNNAVEPISFTVPRKSDIFQADIYPDTSSGAGVPGLTAAQWLAGENAEAPKVSLEGGYTAPSRAADDFQPVKKEEDTGPKSEVELRAEYERLKNRVSFLEAEIVKKDAKIVQLGGTP